MATRRICDADDCTTVLSIYNPDDKCATCHAKVPLHKLSVAIRDYLTQGQAR